MLRRLFITICLIGGITLTANAAEAQFKWFGISELCFEGTFKGGSVKEGVATILIKNVEIRAGCLEITSNSVACQSGKGNAGDITVEVPASADPTKERGLIFANGCISLDPWDHHFLADGITPNPEHQHICHPFENKNKVEIPDTAHIPQIDTEYVVTGTGGQVIARGFQTCFWDGTVNPETCEPTHNTTFTCPIDEIFKK